MNSKMENNSSEASPVDLDAEISLTRTNVSYKNLSDNFRYGTKDFSKQFAHIYAGRLNAMRDVVAKEAHKKWGSEYSVRKLSELTDKSGKAIVIGTLFKHQELKPSILKEISEENQLIPQPPRSNFVSDTDLLILEDEVQRVQLVGNLSVNKLVTGVVVALLGSQNDKGKFVVDDLCFPGPGPCSSLKRELVEDDCYIVIVSGLSFSTATDMLATELLTDWITGCVGCVADQSKQAKIARVIIAGNSVKCCDKASTNVVNTSVEDCTSTLASIKTLDDILSILVKSVEVDLMPGEFDPSNHTLPQQPIHNCMFPKSNCYSTFQCVSNPYLCELGGRKFVGTSGQTILDIMRLTTMEDSLEVLNDTLHWGHLAPTAPDTLACYPYYEKDPFVMTVQPDIYFAGGQTKFQTKSVTINDKLNTRLVCVPNFATTQTCAVINLKNLECLPVSFKTS